MYQGARLNGLEVYIANPVIKPNFRLSTELKLSTSFRNEIDKWCNELFGFEYIETVKDGEVIKANGKLIMNRKTFDEARRLL